jgi:hypothetical protein
MYKLIPDFLTRKNRNPIKMLLSLQQLSLFLIWSLKFQEILRLVRPLAYFTTLSLSSSYYFTLIKQSEIRDGNKLIRRNGVGMSLNECLYDRMNEEDLGENLCLSLITVMPYERYLHQINYRQQRIGFQILFHFHSGIRNVCFLQWKELIERIMPVRTTDTGDRRKHLVLEEQKRSVKMISLSLEIILENP